MLSYHYSTDKGKIEGMLTNIISVGCKPKDTEIAEKINELNGLVKNIIELGKQLIMRIIFYFYLSGIFIFPVN